jgi:S1-C subfamily serine protease
MAFTPQGVPTQGLGFAIPADVVRDSVNRFKQMATKQRKLKESPAPAEPGGVRVEKLFGMQLQDLNSELSDALGYLRGRGVLITAVEPDSPADDAGIKRGMVLYRVNKSDVSTVRQVEDSLRSVQSGANVDFAVGVIRATGRNHELAALSLTAR